MSNLIEEAREWGINCPSCKALMVPATTTLSWWDCINPHCLSNEQPDFHVELDFQAYRA